jgi:hypothetical protein
MPSLGAWLAAFPRRTTCRSGSWSARRSELGNQRVAGDHLWLLALRRENVNVSFWEFFKVGVVVMPISLAAATLGSLAASALG